MEALGKAGEDQDDLALASELGAFTHTAVPEAVAALRSAPVLHNKTVRREEMQDAVLAFLGIA